MIADESHLLMVEYKNANIPGACNPGAFNSMEDKNIGNGIRLIDEAGVVSIEEWNNHEDYSEYPILAIH